MFSDIEARLRRLEEAVAELDRSVLPKARQGILQYQTALAGFYEVNVDWGKEPLPVTVSGSVGPASGCSGGFAGAVVTFKEHATGATLISFTCDGSGNYSGTVPLPSSPLSVDVVTAPTGTYAARFASSASTTTTLTTGVSATVNFSIATAAGYVCLGICSHPIPTTINFSDSGGGSGTMTWNSSTSRYARTLGVNFGGGGICAAQTNVNVTYTFEPSTGRMQMSYNSFSVNDCPKAGAVGTPFTENAVTMTVSCGPFSATGTFPAGGGDKWYQGGAATYSLNE